MGAYRIRSAWRAVGLEPMTQVTRNTLRFIQISLDLLIHSWDMGNFFTMSRASVLHQASLNS